MRLFLCGGGSGEQTAEAVKRFCGILDRGKPLLYIPLAMEPEKYPGCMEWITGELGGEGISDIDMVVSAEELAAKRLDRYAGLYIGGGNTFRLLERLKRSGAFENIKRFISQGGAVFGGSAGAIIFGKDLEACAIDDNVEDPQEAAGFDVLGGISLLCHYTNRTEEYDRRSTEHLKKISERTEVIALPEEDTIFINGDITEVIGTRPWYRFKNGCRRECQPGMI